MTRLTNITAPARGSLATWTTDLLVASTVTIGPGPDDTACGDCLPLPAWRLPYVVAYTRSRPARARAGCWAPGGRGRRCAAYLRRTRTRTRCSGWPCVLGCGAAASYGSRWMLLQPAPAVARPFKFWPSAVSRSSLRAEPPRPPWHTVSRAGPNSDSVKFEFQGGGSNWSETNRQSGTH